MSDPYRQEDDLAYGQDYSQSRAPGQQGPSDRNLIGDTLKKFKTKYDQYSQKPPAQDFGYGSPAPGQQQYGQSNQSGYQSQNRPPYGGSQPSYGSSQPAYTQGQSGYGSNQPNYPNQPAYVGGPPPNQSQQGTGKKPDLASKLFGEVHGAVSSIGTDLAGLLGTQHHGYNQGPPGSQTSQTYQGPGSQTAQGYQGGTTRNRFDSFTTPKDGNQVKWYVDGCSYMWAVSLALENARESIWILDWWLSPELYLRRPPAANEEWRIDRVLQRAAGRGVKINVIVYKEVTQALTLSSSHTKHALEALSPNIGVFRHPDHLPDAQTAQSSLISSLQGLKLDAAGASKLGADALKGVYGFNDDVILYWAHHEKLCLIDGHLAFMGGLDLCFGRWDTNQHSISDAHPSDLNKIVFPGQDFNNARVSDFDDVANPFQNKLDRTKSSRMGWSDLSICLRGPCVDDLRHHFTSRWNFIYDEKYNVRSDVRYSRLPSISGYAGNQPPRPTQGAAVQQTLQSGQYAPPPGSQPYTPPPWQFSVRPTTPGGSYLATSGQQTTHTNIPSQSTGQQYGALPPPPSGPPPSSSYSQPQTHAVYDTMSHDAQVPPSSQPGYGSHTPAMAPQYSAETNYSSYDAPTTTQPLTQQSQQIYTPPVAPQGQVQPSYSTYAPSDQTYTQAQPSYQHYDQSAQTTAPHFDAYHQTPPNQIIQPAIVTPPNTSELPAQSTPYQPYHATQTRGFDDDQESYQYGHHGERGFGGGSRVDKYRDEGRRLGSELGAIGNRIQSKVEQKVPGNFFGSYGSRPSSRGGVGMNCQLLRSCTKWSNGTPTEKSVQNAYIEVIQNSQHFIYIENQFFITATGDHQGPVKNQIGKALVERILRAARENTPFKVIVLMPAIPAFAGDFSSDASLGTRAICEFQYNSICRGEHSIMQQILKAGYNPMDYIRFYNLRNYDRINYTTSMIQAQQQSGVSYEDARKQQENSLGAGYAGQGYSGQAYTGPGLQGQPAYAYSSNPAQQYQGAAQNMPNTPADRWDSVASCYMLNGEDIRNVPWSGPPEAEIDAFVSEELYIHSKIMIVDDRIVICGSANLNDRSMLGTHDSEIALLINDPTPHESTMAGRPWQTSRFATSLRRQLFRKHLGLIPPQDMRRPDANFEPVNTPNAYDWGSPEDHVVSDPLSTIFQSLWNSRARTNTEVYRKAFRAVPDDYVRSWGEYKEFYEYYFHDSAADALNNKPHTAPRVGYGHVVREDFPGGVKELKDLLSQVKGTLVEMPLCFLQDEDIARKGLSLNALTEELYT